MLKRELHEHVRVMYRQTGISLVVVLTPHPFPFYKFPFTTEFHPSQRKLFPWAERSMLQERKINSATGTSRLIQ